MISPAVSAFADAALLLPAAAIVLLYLAVLRQGRLVLALAACLAGAAIVTIGLKLVFHACGHTIQDIRVISPSGHVAFGTTFYGTLALLLGAGRPVTVQRILWVASALLFLAIGVSRVRVGAHSVPEVIIGYGVGFSALLAFSAMHRWAGRPTLPWIPLAAGFTLAVLLLFGTHFSLEGDIAVAARRLSGALDVCEM